jgi:hypothetical protein
MKDIKKTQNMNPGGSRKKYEKNNLFSENKNQMT